MAANNLYLSAFFVFQITGGSSGIGKALARESLRRGAAVVTILARNKVRCLHQTPIVDDFTKYLGKSESSQD